MASAAKGSTDSRHSVARVLLPWLSEQRACLLQAGLRSEGAADPRFLERARKAQSALEKRAEWAPVNDTISPAPPALDDYAAKLFGSKSAQELLVEGYAVKLVDLRRLCAVQEYVYLSEPGARTPGAVAGDWVSIARSTLPLPQPMSVATQYDPDKQAWIIRSADTNLRIYNNWATPLENGLLGFGFAVALLPSLMNVVVINERPILRDGYHRALSLLRNGIHQAPALVRESGTPYDVSFARSATLPAAIYLGPKPPTLADYLDETYSVEVQLPSPEKMIVIQGLELNPVS